MSSWNANVKKIKTNKQKKTKNKYKSKNQKWTDDGASVRENNKQATPTIVAVKLG